jgi:predicted ATPase
MAITVNHDITLPANWGTLNNALGFVGTIENELQFNDVQIQIAKEKAEGYYIEWKGHRIDLDSKGTPSCWPLGWLDQSQYAFSELRAVRAGREVDDSYDWRHND